MMTHSSIPSDNASWNASVRVDLPERPTDVAYGCGLFGTLHERIQAWLPGARRIAWIVDEYVYSHWPVPRGVEQAFDVARIELPRGERAKTWETLERVVDELLTMRRDEPVIVVGGGAATDLGGAAACLARRGMPWMAVPTTVVGMCDAAIGGKVAINTDAGKNLVGAFYPPRHVVCDLGVLHTLDRRDLRAGLAEIYKCGWVASRPQLDVLPAPDSDPVTWGPWIAAAGQVKAMLVVRDERDLAERRRLNYGHTVGHALERLCGNEVLRHGEAVAIGMMVAAEISVVRGHLPSRVRDAQRTTLRRAGLPVSPPPGLDDERVLEVVARDKKRGHATRQTLILPAATGDSRTLLIATDVDRDEIRSALQRSRGKETDRR